MKLSFEKFKLSETILLRISVIAIIAYYLPYFIFGEDANILIHDNLDSNITWIKLLIDNDAIFANPAKLIRSPLNGLHLHQVYGVYDIPLFIFRIFGMYYGYVINKLIIAFIGFWGLYFLLKTHFLKKSVDPLILVGSSLIFALLPFWSFSATVLGLPFVLFSFLNLRIRNKNIYNWVIILVFGFYSSLVLSGIFILILLTLIWLYDTIKSRKCNWKFFIGLAVLSVVYFFSHFPLFYGFLFDHYQSHRLEFFKDPTSFWKALRTSVDILVSGQYHAHSLHKYIFIPIVGSLLYGYKSYDKTIWLILLFIVFTSIFYGFSNYLFIKPFIDSITHIVPLQLERFHFLHPMFWYVLFAVALSWIWTTLKYGKEIGSILIVLQLIIVILNHEMIVNRGKQSFKEYYSTEAFEKIKNDINKPISQYRIISVGFDPSVTQYNGFYTLDGYFPSYSLDYKHQFRSIIHEELDRNNELKYYFDNWGSRCYAFSSELNRNVNKQSIDSLRFDFQQFRKMGGAYVLSKVPINENVNREIKLVDVVSTSPKGGVFYVYRVINKERND